MENEVDRRLLAKQSSRFFAANDDGVGFLAQIIVGRERDFGMPAASHMAILERIAFLVIAVRQPFRVGDDLGGAMRHRPTLPSASGAGKQP